MRSIAVLVIASLAVISSAQIFPSQADRSVPDRDYTFSVDVGLVLLPVTVLDKSGRFVDGLQQSDFTVYEDGKPQEIQVFEKRDIPVAVGLIIDNSTSMVPKREHVIAAALELAEASNPEDEIFVVHFYDHIVFALKLGEAFTSDIADLKAAVSRIAGLGRTALYDAVIAGLEHLQMSRLRKRVLVVISDGGDNASTQSRQEMLDKTRRSDALIYSIGIYTDHERDRNPKVLKELAGITGGEAYFPRNESQLSEVCKRIATDIRSQYMLGYIPKNQEKDGNYRKIKVSVEASDRGRLTVRTRSGYLAPNANDITEK